MRRIILALALLAPLSAAAQEPRCDHERPACAEGQAPDPETGACVPVTTS